MSMTKLFYSTLNACRELSHYGHFNLQGCHTMENFIMNYEDLPEQCVYGEFLTEVFITKGGNKISCIAIELECEEKKQDGSM